jgi:Sulfotransferase family
MIISHKHRFIFIKTAKTAGTSVEVFLSQQCGPDDIVTPIYPHVEPHVARNFTGYFNPIPEIYSLRGRGFKDSVKDVIKRRRFYNHISSLQVRSRIARTTWKNYFKFCIERNPWDKTVSHYYNERYNERWLSGNQLSFDAYLSRQPFALNYPLYTDCQNNVLVDRIVKYENLTDELQVIFKMLGVPFNGSLGAKAKSEYRPSCRPYQEMYTEEQKNIVQKVFDIEIRMHGYAF